MREEYLDKWVDYYKDLEIEFPSNEKEIKKAHRILSKKYHPDMNPSNKEAEKKFKKAQIAYDVLFNPTRKKEYDFYYKIKMPKKQKNTEKSQTHNATSQKLIVGLIKEASTLEELANIWKYIDIKFKYLLEKKEFYTQLIKEKLPNVIFKNPFFYKKYIDFEQKDGDEKLQLYFYKMKCIFILFDEVSLNVTISLNAETQINKEYYFQDMIRNSLCMIKDIVSSYKLENQNTIDSFYHTLLLFNYFMVQTNNEAKMYFIAQMIPNPNNSKLNYLLSSFKKKLTIMKEKLEFNTIDFYEEITEAVEKNSSLHYGIAYSCLKYLPKDSINLEKKIKVLLYDVRMKLRMHPFNVYEFTLLNQLLLEFNDYKKIKVLNCMIYALTAALDNENLQNELDIYHHEFYEALLNLPLTDLEKDAQESIQQLFSIYSSFYSKETIEVFQYNTKDLKR